MLFLFADNCCANSGTAADEQQCHPQHKVAVIAGLRRFRIVRQFIRSGVVLGDFFCRRSIGKILTATLAVPVFDIALGILGGGFCRNAHKVGVIVRVNLAVGCVAVFANCLRRAGCRTAGVVGQLLAADVALVILVVIRTLGENLFADVALVILVVVRALGEGLFADVALVILVVIRALGEGLFADVTLVIKKELKY